ncbi:unnamed protein product [Lactuca saligna]|uniref:Uncharacterized protein n=1 Tax=Lactuca saligna TaxID=75948 RepID=A0AA36EJN3_LACSI|nr:unnamed protein product [Lactuca saligna]
MTLLVGQSSACIAGDLCYAATQTYALMVAAIDWVFLAGASKGKLKVLYGVGMREYVCDSEAEHQVLAEQNKILTCEKAVLKDQVATLTDRSERLEDQVSSLTQEKDVLASRLARWGWFVWLTGSSRALKPLVLGMGRLLSSCSTSSGKSNVLDPDQVVSRPKEVNTALTSFISTDFAGLLHLGELDYDGFHQFCGKLSLGCSSLESEG